MKQLILSLLTFIVAVPSAFSQTPVLGTYSSITIAAPGGDTTVVPSIAPVNVISATATTTPDFKGQLSTDPFTGTVRVVNAHPAGTYLITVRGFNGNNTATTSFTLMISSAGCGLGQFINGSGNSSGANTTSVAIADFNKDGRQDLALSVNGSATVMIRLGNGSGGFAAAISVPVNSVSQMMAVADFNGDGNTDFASAAYSAVSVRLGDGTGNFSGNTEVPVGLGSQWISIADFNGDGRADFVTANSSSNTLSVRLGDGTGSFNSTADIAINGPAGVAVADFNGDLIPDIAVTSRSGSSISILTGNGQGAFSTTTVLTLPTGPVAIVAGDFNRDGKADLAFANPGAASLSIRLGNGNGGFTIAANQSVGSLPSCIAVGDFNGDNNADLVVANQGGLYGSMTVLYGDGTGDFNSTPFTTTAAPGFVAIGDFNKDGRQDLATSNVSGGSFSTYTARNREIDITGNNISIPAGSTNPSPNNGTSFGSAEDTATRIFTIRNGGNVALNINGVYITGPDSAMYSFTGVAAPAVLAVGATVSLRVLFTPVSAGLKTARINVTSDDCDESLYTFTIQGTGTPATVVTGNYVDTVLVVASSSATVAASSAPSNSVGFTASAPGGFRGTITVNNTTGSISVTNAYPAGTYLVKLKAYRGFSYVADSFTLIVSNPVCSQVQYLAGTSVTASGDPYALAIGDFNTDGKQDLVIANRYTNNVNLRLGNGTTGFTGTISVAVGKDPANIAIADFNGDGNADFITANSGDSTVSICLGNGTGLFTSTSIAFSAAPYGLVAGDFNNDGKPDFVACSYVRNKLFIRMGDGKGGFLPRPDGIASFQPQFMGTGDFNGDGNADLAVATESQVIIFTGNGMGDFTQGALLNNLQYPNGMLVADVNKDGKPDIITTDGTSKMYVMLGNGNGTFAAPTTYVTGTNPTLITSGDFNGDGNPDLAVFNSIRNGSGTADIAIMLGNGTGSFTATTSLTQVGAPRAIITGDVNNDQRQDLIISNQSSTLILRINTPDEIDVTGNNISIASGDTIPSPADLTDFGSTSGSVIRSFTIKNMSTVKLTVRGFSVSGADSARFTVQNLTLPFDLRAGDSTTVKVNFVPRSSGLKKAMFTILNDDCDEAAYSFAIQGTGVVRLTPGAYPATVTVKNGGNITVSPSAAPSGTGTSLNAYTSSAFKGSLVVNPATGVVSVTNAQPVGTYTITIGDPVASRSFQLIVGNGTCGSGRFQDSAAIVFPYSCGAAAIGDLNNDGRQDLIVSQLYPSDVIYLLLNNGSGGFTTSLVYRINGNIFTYSIVTADFNGDGNLDFATEDEDRIYVCLGDGAGGVLSRTSFTYSSYIGSTVHILATGDFNGDGRPDMVVSNVGSNTMSTCLNDGTGSFTLSRTVVLPNTSSSSNTGSLTVTDIDSDGKEDVLIGAGGASFAVMKGDGTGNFISQQQCYIGTNVLGIATGLFNQDQRPDVVALSSESSGAAVFLNAAGTLPYFGSSGLSTQSSPRGVATGDVNGDGTADVVIASNGGNSASVWLGYGNGTFYGNRTIPVVTGPMDVLLGDFNQDGKLDMAVPGANKLTLRTSRSSQVNVQGNSRNILIGNTTPDTANFTHFGNVTTGDSTTRQYVVQNTGTDTLRVADVFITGPDSLSFSQVGTAFPAVLLPGTSKSFTIRFRATGNGLRRARIGVITDDCDESYYTFSISAKAACPPSADNIWLGITAAWNDPANWSLGQTPADCSRVVINTGVPFMPQISTAASCYSLTLNNGATFTVTGTGSLTITGP